MRKYALSQLLGTVTNLFVRDAGKGENKTVAIDFTVANAVQVDGRNVIVYAPVSIIGKQAEILQERLAVGTTVFVSGSLLQENWTKDDDDGKPRKYSRTKVAASRIEILSGEFEMTRPKEGQKAKPHVANGINSTTIAGNLTAAPTLRRTHSAQDAVVNFTVAMNREYKDRAGKTQKEVSYIEVTLWREQAQAAIDQLKKGDAVIVDGHLVSESWTDREGRPRQELRVEGTRFFCVAGAPRTEQTEQAEPEPTEADLPPVNPDAAPDSEELPF